MAEERTEESWTATQEAHTVRVAVRLRGSRAVYSGVECVCRAFVAGQGNLLQFLRKVADAAILQQLEPEA